MKCDNCDRMIRGRGHNGMPLVEGKVCDECNKEVLIERMQLNKGFEKYETGVDKILKREYIN